MEAISQAGAAVGILASDGNQSLFALLCNVFYVVCKCRMSYNVGDIGVVLAAEKRITSKVLQFQPYCTKINLLVCCNSF
jgi:hypothetical protein